MPSRPTRSTESPFSNSYLQFYPLEERVVEAHGEALRGIFQGPGNWVAMDDLYALHTQFGFPLDIPILQYLNRATKLRVFAHEVVLSSRNWRFHIDSLMARARRDEDSLAALCHPWRRWYREGILHSILEQADYLEEKGITKLSVFRRIGWAKARRRGRRPGSFSRRQSTDGSGKNRSPWKGAW